VVEADLAGTGVHAHVVYSDAIATENWEKV
jgi:hypothetical protein